MKAISLWQPWAQAIAHGTKKHETRSWAPPANLIGEWVAIHAAKRKPKYDDHPALLRRCTNMMDTYGCGFHEMPLGKIVAVVRLVAVHKTESMLVPNNDIHPLFGSGAVTPWLPDHDKLSDRDFMLGNYEAGRFAWELADVVKLETPVATRGFQRIWTLSDELSDELMMQVRAASIDPVERERWIDRTPADQ